MPEVFHPPDTKRIDTNEMAWVNEFVGYRVLGFRYEMWNTERIALL